MHIHCTITQGKGESEGEVSASEISETLGIEDLPFSSSLPLLSSHVFASSALFSRIRLATKTC
jgi:hypothetical protein